MMKKLLMIVAAVLMFTWALPHAASDIERVPKPCISQDGGESCMDVSLSFKHDPSSARK